MSEKALLRARRVTKKFPASSRLTTWISTCALAKGTSCWTKTEPVLTSQGIIYISYRLQELHEVGDRVTVLRGGQFILAGLVGSGRTDVARAIFGLDRHNSGTILPGWIDKDLTATPAP